MEQPSEAEVGAAIETTASRTSDADDFQFNFGSHMIRFIIGALAFITALAWNNALQTLLQAPELQKDGPWISALIITGGSLILGFVLYRTQYEIDKEGYKLMAQNASF